MNKELISTEQAFRVLDKNTSWVAAADAKVPPLLAIGTAMLGALAASLPKAKDITTAVLLATCTAGALIALSIVCLSMVVIPRLRGPTGSLIYFGGIASFTREQYLKRMKVLSQEDLLREILIQCHRNAEIASRKHLLARLALTFLLSSIAPWTLAMLLIYISRN